MHAAITLSSLTKTFGPVIACDSISLSVERGEILALLGENGSGKTTLMNMLSGLYYPDQGQILLAGKPADIRSPRDALDLGIGMIHQHFLLVDVLSAAENIVLGLPGGALINRKQVVTDLRALADRYGFHVDPNRKIYRMAISEKQTVEILKVLYRGAEVLILDEPTAVLTPQETDRLFDVLKAMKADGKAIIIITHKLHEVLAVSDRVAILRKGKLTGIVDTKDATAQSLTDLMVGRATSLEIKRRVGTPKPLVEVQGVTIGSSHGPKELDNISFNLFSGEILGVAGVSGSGQKPLCEAMTGLQRIAKGSISVDGQAIHNLSPEQIEGKAIHIGFVPEDRLGMGLVGRLSITENILLRGFRKQKGPFLRRKPAYELACKLIDRLEIATTGPSQPVSRMSGGNVQKVLLGRELEDSPRVIVVSYPVRGLDVGASHTVYDLLQKEKLRGAGVLFVGEDLDVLLALCDRILVLCGGRMTGIVDARTATREQIGLMMTQHEGASA